MRIERPEPDVFAVDGTPTDCVLIAAHGLLDRAPDLVVSGVNRGPNMGDDVFYSGTVAAAIEGAMQGVPALAISLASAGAGRVDFQYACSYARRLVGTVLERGLPPKSVLNVNVPQRRDDEIKGVRVTRLGKRTYQDSLIERTDPLVAAYYWIGSATLDLGAGGGDRLPRRRRGLRQRHAAPPGPHGQRAAHDARKLAPEALAARLAGAGSCARVPRVGQDPASGVHVFVGA
jgi:5'-nucleotidase